MEFQHKNTPETLFKPRVLAQTIIITCITAASLTINAQETENNAQETEKEIEEIIVLGSYSGGLSKALDIKRNADSISDAIIASDIGKLPAVNIAEALQRVPGVSINREGGEGQFISVRGLGPNFQSVTFNGSPIAFNENIRNSDQSGRQFRFRVIPADLIGGLVVTKSPTATLIDGGVGSNLNLRTINPLAKDPFLSARVFQHFEDQADEDATNASLSGGWQNDAGTFGVIGGISYSERDVRFDRLQLFGYTDRVIEGTAVRAPSQLATTLEQESRKRTSLLGGIQWQPNEHLDISLDVLYSQFENTIAENRISYEFGGNNNAFSSFVPESIVIKNGIVTAAMVNGPGEISRNAEFSAQEHENTFVNLKLDYAIGGWTMSPSFSYSEATSDLLTPLQRIDSRLQGNLEYAYDLGDDPVGDVKIARLNTELDLSDPDSVPFRRYRIRPINAEDKDATILLNFSRDLGITFSNISLNSVDFGLQYTDRSRDYQRRDRTLQLKTDAGPVDGTFYTTFIPSDAFDSTIDAGESGWVGPTLGTFTQVFEGTNDEFTNPRVQASDLVATNSDLQSSYGVDEEITAFYGQLNFSSKFHGVPVTGNLGIRWVETKSEVSGTLLTAGEDENGAIETVPVPTVFENDYAEVLPSLNLTFKLQENVLLRAAISKSLTRPSLADLRTALVPNSVLTSDIFEQGAVAVEPGSGAENVTDASRAGTGGNPELKPYVSTNVDMSLEWYFRDFGVLSISTFYKNISDFIQPSENIETLLFALDPALNQGTTLPLDILVARPTNVGDANITGFELGYTDRLSSGLGIATSITFLKASVEEEDGTESELQGVSDVNYSIGTFFERGPFEINVNWTWRSKYSTNSNASIGTAAANSGDQPVNDSFGTLDLGASYQITNNFQVFVEGTNLTDEKQGSFLTSDNVFRQAQAYGTSYNLGLKINF